MNYQQDVSLTMANEMIARQQQRVELLSKEARTEYKILTETEETDIGNIPI